MMANVRSADDVTEQGVMQRFDLQLVFFAFLGTLAGAGLFGLLQGGIIGLVVGPMFATSVGILVVPTVFILSWACWLSRFRIATSVVAGAVTGVVCTMRSFDALFAFPYGVSLTLSAVLGGTGAGFAAWLTKKSHEPTHQQRPVFSLSDLFRHVTVLAATIAAWTYIIGWVMENDARIEKQNQELQRQLEAYGSD